MPRCAKYFLRVHVCTNALLRAVCVIKFYVHANDDDDDEGMVRTVNAHMRMSLDGRASVENSLVRIACTYFRANASGGGDGGGSRRTQHPL